MTETWAARVESNTLATAEHHREPWTRDEIEFVVTFTDVERDEDIAYALGRSLYAVWAIQQAGFKAVIAKQTATEGAFSDIFRQNSANCGLLLIPLVEQDWVQLRDAGSGAEVTIDLPNQTVTLGEGNFSFEIAPANKRAIEQGLDLIGNTLLSADAIEDYERERGPFVPPRA